MQNLREKGAALWWRIFEKERLASNPDYHVHGNVHKQLRNGKLTVRKLLPRTDNKQQRKLLETVCALANKRRAGEPAEPLQIDAAVIYIANNMPHMTVDFLGIAERIALASGLFTLAYQIREISEKLVMRNFENGDFIMENSDAAKLFWSCLRSGDEGTIKELASTPGDKCSRKAAQHICKLCMSLGIIPREPDSYQKDQADVGFADYIRNKKVAIIGPSMSSSKFPQSENFDVVLRMNYRGSDTLPEAQRGIATQVAYYRGKYIDALIRQGGNTECLKELDFAVLSTHAAQELLKACGFEKTRVVRKIPDFFFLGKFSFLQLILHDLLYFEPARIKVFGCNCSLSGNIYDKGYYPPGSEPDVLASWRQHSSHNIISQYDYVRHLYERKLIEADTRFSEILELGTAEYMRQMEEQENSKEI